METLHDDTELEAHVSQQELERLCLYPGQDIYAVPRRLDVYPISSVTSDPDWVI